MALAERPTLTAEEKEALLERLRAMYPEEPASDDVPGRLGFDLDPDPVYEYEWHNLGEEEPDPDPLPVNAAGMAAMVRFFALLEEERPAWQRDALCIEYPDLPWFPGRGENLRPLRDVCARCLVREECHAYAIAQGVESGVWGGASGRSLKRNAA